MGTGRAAVLLGVLLVALLWSARPAAAQDDTGWQIDAFDVEIVVQPDGVMRVHETIAVDFRDLDRHGIFREIPVRYDVAANDTQVEIPEGRRADEYERVITISDIEVSSTAPDDVLLEDPGVTGRFLRIRIGDEDRTVSGPQTYTIRYTVTGALNAFETHDEMYWNATGTDWEVPIVAATTKVTAPGIEDAVCFRGTLGATGQCGEVVVDGDTAQFVSNGLQAGEGMTVGVSFPSDAVEVAPPVIRERWTLSRAFTGAPAAAPAAATIGVLGLAGVGLLGYRQGRDRVTRGGVAVDGRVDAPVTRRRLFSGRVTPVEFHPPDDLRPAQIGVLVDERVDPVDVSATIVDLAVRGYLRIVEIQEKQVWRTKTDWELQRLEEASTDNLLAYEQRLLDALFAGRTHVKVSDLKGTFADDYNDVRKLLYDDSVERKIFPRRPDSVRTRWLVLGILLTIFGFGGLILAMLITTWAMVMVPVFIIGVVLTIAHRWMPHRTAKGSRALDKALGFRQFIVNAEAGRAEYAEQQNLFVPYLPYAVVFGAVDKWAATFAALAAAGGAASGAGLGYWYVGAHPGHFDANSFSSGLSDFSNSVGATLPTAAPSTSSTGGGGGFSGGGFGGGGGGSW